jgi:preprotein translocase subunit SecY
MNTLSYLFFTKLKNRIACFFKSPGKVIYLLFLCALIGISVLSGNRSTQEKSGQLRDLSELIAGAIGVYSFLFILIAKTGFGNGASLFSMADINLVFPAPVPARTVLFYGLFQQMGTPSCSVFSVCFSIPGCTTYTGSD